MSAATTAPVTISPEVRVRAAELGMERQLDQMVEQCQREVPALRSIDATLEHDPEGEDEPRIVIWCKMNDRGVEYDATEDELGAWKVTTFPPEVCRHFVILTDIYPP